MSRTGKALVVTICLVVILIMVWTAVSGIDIIVNNYAPSSWNLLKILVEIVAKIKC